MITLFINKFNITREISMSDLYPQIIQPIHCTVMRFQQFQSPWNKNLLNLNPVKQTVAQMKACIKS